MTLEEFGGLAFISFTVLWAYTAIKMFGEPEPRPITISREGLKQTVKIMKVLK